MKLKYLRFLVLSYVPSVCHSVSILFEEVAGGREAKPHSVPYIVSIRRKIPGEEYPVHYGAGTIINEHWILTAAHCIPNKSIAKQTVIYAGCHDIRDGNSSAKETASRRSNRKSHSDGRNAIQKRYVDDFVVHELYNGGVSPYDIALIRVNEPFVFNNRVKAATLPKSDTNPKGYGFLYGWGSTSLTCTPSFPNKLQKVKVPILDYEECERALGGPGVSPLHPTNLCTGPLSGGISACTSDSGGPLIQVNSRNGQNIVIGIVSWGRFPCGQPNSPTVYVKVSCFINWIRKRMILFENSHYDPICTIL